MAENKGWIKLHRSLLDWEWFDDHNTTRLLIYLLVSANYEQKKWKGQTINEGQLITSNSKLASAVGLSVQNIRSSLNKLKINKQITIKSTNKFQLISLVKWAELQNNEEATNNQKELFPTIEQQSNNNQITTTKESKESKEIKEYKEIKNINNITFDFKKNLLDFGFEEKLVNEWLKIRKTKKAVNTETAFKGFISNVEKSHLNKNEILKICVEKSWSGFDNAWIQKTQQNGNTTTKQTASEQFAELQRRMEKRVDEAFDNV